MVIKIVPISVMVTLMKCLRMVTLTKCLLMVTLVKPDDIDRA